MHVIVEILRKRVDRGPKIIADLYYRKLKKMLVNASSAYRV